MQCQHPNCKREATEAHHIIFRSFSRKKALDDDWNIVYLCSEHHRGSKEAPHTSSKWRYYYYQFLPSDWKTIIKNCKELRKKKKYH